MIEVATENIMVFSFKFWKNEYSEKDVMRYLEYFYKFFLNSPYDITIKVFTKEKYYFVLFKMLKN